MADSMSFPNTFDECAEQFKIIDKEEVYTNGIELIPIFRVKQWLAHKADVVEIPKSDIGDLSDGYHTFNELYRHRAVLFSVICNSVPDKAWKSKLHDTGDMFEGMFIAGIETPEGQATYHCDIEPYWDMFKVRELEKAPKWDGHTPADVINRIAKLSAYVAEVSHGEWFLLDECANEGVYCSICHKKVYKKCYANQKLKSIYCPNCGAKMDGE